MILGSHNSWSYLTPIKWWMRLFKFVGKCQDVDIITQYEKYNVRCFDLRLKFDNLGRIFIVHGKIKYKYSYNELIKDLKYLNSKKDCYVRIIHDIRNEKECIPLHSMYFVNKCNYFSIMFPNIKFWCGENLFTKEKEYNFPNNPTCEELYSSVVGGKLNDVWPRLYAEAHNNKIIKKGTNKDILMIDFVNYV